MVSKAGSPFSNPVWSVRTSIGVWALTADCHGQNKATPSLSAAVLGMLEAQYELKLKAARWYATTEIARAFFSIPQAA